MKIGDVRYILDDLLADWHRWAKGYSAGAHSACAMFIDVKSSRQYDDEGDVADADLHRSKMKSIDFHVGELEPLFRTALQIQARNLVTGFSVWTSARLPVDVVERAVILRDARNNLQDRLMKAGIL